MSSSSPLEEFDNIDWDNVNWEDQGMVGIVDRNLFAPARAGRAGGGRSRMARNRNAPAAGRARVGARAGASSLVIRINTCVKYVICNSHADKIKK